MANEKRNALAELAEKINADRGIFRAFKDDLGDTKGEVGGLVDEDFRKASCIIAELAKVTLNGVGWPVRLELADAYEKCREIAEEECTMETNNETVANVRDDMFQVVADEFGNVTMAQSDFVDYAVRFVAAHKREIGELKGERKGILKANAQFAADNTRLRGELAEKDAEIARLRALVNELADALEYWLCDYDCETNGKCRCPADMKREECESFKRRALIANAREAIGGGK